MSTDDEFAIEYAQAIDAAAEVMRRHYLDPEDMNYCVCGDWDDSDQNPDDWDAHLADALADAGLLKFVVVLDNKEEQP